MITINECLRTLRRCEASLKTWQLQHEQYNDSTSYRCYTRQLAATCELYASFASIIGPDWPEIQQGWQDRCAVLQSTLSDVDHAWLTKEAKANYG